MRRRVANEPKAKETVCRHWCGYVRPFKIDPYLQERKLSWDWVCFLITVFTAEARSGNYGLIRDVTVLTVKKIVSAVKNTTSMASNRETGPLKLSKTK